MKKLLVFLLSLFSSLFFSSSASALDFSQSVQVDSVLNPSWECLRSEGSSESWGACAHAFATVPGTIRAVRSSSSYSIVSGNYYEVRVSFLGLSSSSNPVGSLWTVYNNNYFDLVDFSSSYSSINQTSNGSYLARQNETLTFILRAKVTGSYPLYLGAESSSLFILQDSSTIVYPYGSVLVYSASSVDVAQSAESAAGSLEDMNSKDNSDRSNIESQSSNGNSAADSSQESTKSRGTTLLGAFSSFVGALTDTSSGSCSISVNTGLVDFGSVDLCAVSVPPAFQVISSLVVIGFAVPLSISTCRKLISLFRSFTG